MEQHIMTTQNEYGNAMATAGQAANVAAQKNVWNTYHAEITENTRRRQMNDLASYCAYLADAGITRSPEELFSNPEAWRGTSYGLLAGYVQWSMLHSYAIGTINVRLATLRKYCELAGPSPVGVGILTEEELRLIQTVKGTDGKKARNLDRDRASQGIATRLGAKKAEATPVSTGTALKLKKVTMPKARGTEERDHLLMGLLIEHALRCGEIRDLDIEDFDLTAGTFTTYREKTDEKNTHRMKRHTRIAAETYIAKEARTQGPLFMGNKGKRITERAINKRVGELGEQAGTETLSPPRKRTNSQPQPVTQSR